MTTATLWFSTSVAQQVGQLVERVAHELLEVVVVVGVEVEELGLVGLGGDALAGQALGAQDDLLEVLLGLRARASRPCAGRW